MVRAVRSGPLAGLVAQLVLLAALAATVGLGGAGWVVGTTCGVVTAGLLARGLARRSAVALGPADQVTLVRATISGGVAALVADAFTRPAPVPVLVALTVVGLLLDAVDGRVARSTGTASTLGARFDMEVDAFLILALSVYVARWIGPWVLAIGAARYALVASGWLLPWLRGSLPPRAWCKVVAATQGIVLAVAAADVLPDVVTGAALATSLALLTESFSREVWELWCGRHAQPVRAVVPATTPELSIERRYVDAIAGGASLASIAGGASVASIAGGASVASIAAARVPHAGPTTAAA